MDYNSAIERQRQPLLALIATLYAMIGLTECVGMIELLPWKVYRKVLLLLRPAESAVRRLIVVMAHGLVIEPPAAVKAGKRQARSGKSKPKGKRRRLFQLFDPRARLDRSFRRRRSFSAAVPRAEPRIRFLDDGPLSPLYRRPEPPAPPPPPPKPARQDSANAASLCRRLAAIMDALMDLPAQARRFARWRDKPIEERKPKLDEALRPGPPPGLCRMSSHRKSSRQNQEIDEILSECHWLARNLPEPDTS